MSDSTNSTEIRWNANAVDKARLVDDYALDPEYQSIPLGGIDWDKSLNNQNRGREIHVDRQLVDDLGLAILAGKPIDAPIVRRMVDGTLYVLDGNHRLAAARDLGVEHVEAWTVMCDEDQAHMIAMLANIGRHGQGLNRDARMVVCRRLVEMGYDVAHVARVANVRDDTVRQYLRDVELAERWQRLFGRPLVTSGSKSRQVARFADSELDVIGPNIVKAPTSQLKAWASELHKLDPAERLGRAREIRGAVDQMSRAKRATDRRRHTAATLRALRTVHVHLARALDEATAAEAESIADQIHAAQTVVLAKREGRIRVA